MKAKFSLQLVLGLALGALMPWVGIALVLEARPELLGIQKLAEEELVKQINVEIITLGIIINAALFFLGLRLNRDQFSRGILMVSFIYLILIFVYRFLL